MPPACAPAGASATVTFAVSRDITERRALEEQLLQAQ